MKPSTDTKEKLIGIQCLNLLFWNYHVHVEDMNQHDYIRSLYEGTVKNSKKPFQKWWELYFTKTDYPTQIILLEYALAKYRRITEYAMSKSKPFNEE